MPVRTMRTLSAGKTPEPDLVARAGCRGAAPRPPPTHPQLGAQAAAHRLRLVAVHNASQRIHRLAVDQDVKALQVGRPAALRARPCRRDDVLSAASHGS